MYDNGRRLKEIQSQNALQQILNNVNGISEFEKNKFIKDPLLLLSNHNLKRMDFENNAVKILNAMPNECKTEKNVNLMIDFLGLNGKREKLLAVFDDLHKSKQLNIICIAQTIKYLDDRNKTKQIYNRLSAPLFTSLIEFYGDIGNVNEAMFVFDSIPNKVKNIKHCNAMMNALNENERAHESLQLFKRIKFEKDTFCYGVALHSCGILSAETEGIKIIQNMPKQIRKKQRIKAAMISFLTKCGKFEEAINVFSSCKGKMDKFVWSEMLQCFDKMGNAQKVLQIFEELDKNENIQIDDAMYSIVVSVCAHSGFVDDQTKIIMLASIIDA